jgi:hypothetical protein
MGVKLHIRKSILKDLVLSKTQQQLDVTCIPPLGDRFIDHLEVAGVQLTASDTFVNLAVSVNIFIVDLASLEPNGVGSKIPP